MPMLKSAAAIALFVVGTASLMLAQRSTSSGDVVTTAAAANTFLNSLEPAKRAKALLPLNGETRRVWSNLPTGAQMQVGATERNGLKLGDMTPEQERRAFDVLRAVLSAEGFQKVTAIVAADQRLEETTAPTRTPDARTRFGRALFYLAILGTPSPAGNWMVQFGGHHLAINVSLRGGRRVLTPSHTGAQPTGFSLEGKLVRPLGEENDKAFALMNALDASQQRQARLDYQISQMVLGPGEDGKTLAPEGLRASAMNARQRAMLLDLASEWVNIGDSTASKSKMTELEKNLDGTYFAWAGAIVNGEPAYFRIQGPTVHIEYAPGNRNAPGVDHIHTIYRDPTDDYGDKPVRR